ncbi:phosphate/phosphite/phosphonate ABC transporter substrate-binding protein [Evansella cellulosilytica]|uniref:Phosphonate ABC transporter, periplasmic phosphonate-binding protein n=1 Tax=Evansella cellulosilytica (strain ATCC 21833 / DSM 2522 / FERM P-1141 / JCM 9156 / N-4) TaxID=649639 RepID=E6TXT5_EVAC2|nr:phosphate/phosphite/phosphonate ABC transporter substrate-binding protein [Evansella cellulosilytica]ADU30011.1 phosphonate ABC transporter, periplasmic phosphonate-binding protein [Evansella cellulosilytica DSM 2522]
MKKQLTLTALIALTTVFTACGTVDEEPVPGEDTTDMEDTTEDSATDDIEMPDELIMGFVPSQDSDKIADTAAPLADRLSEELGIPVDGRVMTNFTGLIEAMGNNQVQIGFLNPFGYVLATDRYDNIDVILKSIRNGEDSYRAQYTVRADSDIESIEDLEGRVWAFADIASTSGFLFPAAQLMNDYGVEDVNTHFSELIQAGSHDNAMLQLLEGNADVVTSFEDARDTIADDYPEVYDELVQLDFTDPIPNDTISVDTTLPQELIDQIEEIFLSFNDDEEMIGIMQEVYTWTGIAEAEDSDYDIVRDVHRLFPEHF